MATTKREVGTSAKEKKGLSPANSKPSLLKKPSSSSSASGSTEKQAPSNIRPTKITRADAAALRTLKKPAAEDAAVQRRRSFDRPPSAARAQKALISPVRPKMAAGATLSSPSVGSKPAAAPKVPLERVAKKPNAPVKSQTQALSSSRSSHKPSPSAGTKTRKGSLIPLPASRKPPSSPDRREALSVETEHENKENLDHQVEPQAEVVKDDQGGGDDTEMAKADQGEVGDTERPKAEECGNIEAEAVAIDEDTKLTSVVDKGQESQDISSPVSEQQSEMSSATSEQQNESEPEPVPEPEPWPQPQTEKVEDEVEEVKPDHIPQPGDGDKENQSQEEISDGDDPQQENTPDMHQEESPKIEYGGEEHAIEEVAATEETEEEKQPESRQGEDNEGSLNQGLESSKEETVQESDAQAEVEQKAEPDAETEENVEVKAASETNNAISKSHQVQGKKEPAKTYNNLIKETASKLVQERRNKVLALVGAFQNVIDQESARTK